MAFTVLVRGKALSREKKVQLSEQHELGVDEPFRFSEARGLSDQDADALSRWLKAAGVEHEVVDEDAADE